MNKKISVKLDTTPLTNAHRTRGVGVYTKLLLQALKQSNAVKLVDDPRQAQVIHYPFFDLFFNSLPVNLTKKTVVTIHDVIPLVFPQQYKPGIKGNLRLLAQIGKLKFVNAVITDSINSKKDIVNYLKVPFDKIKAVHLAANPAIRRIPQEKLAFFSRKLHLPKKYLLYVGDINYNKNLSFLIKTLKYLPYQLKLVLVGKNFRSQPIPEWAAIEKQIALSDVARRVKFFNQVETDEDLAAIYSASLVYINPSLYEGFGLPILEAMQTKTPVISLRNSSIPEIAGDRVVYLGETNPERLADLVKNVIYWTKSKRKQWVNQAFQRSQQFSWEKTAKETVEVYQKIINHK